jgi:hypothetical protein
MILSEVRPNVLRKLGRAGTFERIGSEDIVATLSLALDRAHALVLQIDHDRRPYAK